MSTHALTLRCVDAVARQLTLTTPNPEAEARTCIRRWLWAGIGAALIAAWMLKPELFRGALAPLTASAMIISGATVGVVGGIWSLRQRHAQAKRRALFALPSWIDAVQLILSGGATARDAVEVASAMVQSSRPNTPLSFLLAGVRRRLALGASLGHAITPIEATLGHGHSRELCALIRLAADDGGRVRPMLDELAQRVRQQHHQLIEEHASHAMAKMLLPLILLMASALLLIVGPFAIHIIEDGL